MDPASRPNEAPAIIFAEHTWLQGAFLAAVAYGMETILFAMSFYLLYTHRSGAKVRDRVLLAYITILFILGTLYLAGLLQFTQQAFIDDRNIEGGPVVYEEVMFSIPIDMLANVIMVLVTWLCDIINVWRCLVIYQNCRVPVWVIAFVPGGMYLSSFALGVLFLKQVGAPSQSPWDAAGVNFTIPYYTMSLALNILVTILIVLRLLVYRSRITKVLGRTYGTEYTSLAAMVVESAAIYSSFSLLFLVPFATGHALSQLFLQALSPVQCVSTLLIVFRVAQGKGWSKDSFKTALRSTTSGSQRPPVSKIEFGSPRRDPEAQNSQIERPIAVASATLACDSDRTIDDYGHSKEYKHSDAV